MRPPPRSLAAAGLAAAVAVTGCSGAGGTRGRHRLPTTATSATTAVGTGPASGSLAAVRVELTKIADVDGPTAMAVRPGDPTLYVTEQAGRVLAVRDGKPAPEVALDLSRQVASGGERGLLGIALAPDGKHVYLDYTNLDGDTRVVEYAMRGSEIDASSARVLLAIAQPQPNHNGGQLAFGPDGDLYVGMGDGGGAGDQGPGHAPGGNAQSLTTLLGKILRIDPTPSNGRPYRIPAGNPFTRGHDRPEIWAYGLRNPWRFSFDRATHDLWIGDVGQNRWEELDYVPAGRGAGDNFGWNRLEGTHPFTGAPTRGSIPPIYEYGHPPDNCAVTGGFVYRGTRIPALAGVYVFADYCAGELHGLTQSRGVVTAQRDLGVHAAQISSFGEDAAGELYVLSQGEGLLRIDPA